MNKVEQLARELGYEEFLTQLIMFEKSYTRKKAAKLARLFLNEDNLSSIFQIQEILIEGS